MHHMRRAVAVVVVLAVAVVLRAMWGSHVGAPSAPPVRDPGQVESPEVPDGAFRAVDDRVVDGDTFLARVSGAGRDLRVRIIGADTPEAVRPGVAVRCDGP